MSRYDGGPGLVQVQARIAWTEMYAPISAWIDEQEAQRYIARLEAELGDLDDTFRVVRYGESAR